MFCVDEVKKLSYYRAGETIVRKGQRSIVYILLFYSATSGISYGEAETGTKPATVNSN